MISTEKTRGFIRVSTTNPLYFATDAGKTFIPIGLNICWPRLVDPADEKTGFAEYEYQLNKLAENGGNFIRIWLGAEFFGVENKQSGKYEQTHLQE